MSFTASPRTARFSGERSCNGLNHKDRGIAGVCDTCGSHVYKTEKGHLVDPAISGSEMHPEVFRCWHLHKCDPRFAAMRDVRDAEALIQGRFPKNTEVEVFKGRKVPVGTVGAVRWIGDGYNDGDMRLGLAVEGQEKLVYVDSRNCRISPEILAAAQATVDADQAQRQEMADRLAYLEAQVQEDEYLRELIGDEYLASGLRHSDDTDAKHAFYAEHIEPVRERQSAAFAEIKAIKEARGY
jgi:hypothetical protein